MPEYTSKSTNNNWYQSLQINIPFPQQTFYVYYFCIFKYVKNLMRSIRCSSRVESDKYNLKNLLTSNFNFTPFLWIRIRIFWIRILVLSRYESGFRKEWPGSETLSFVKRVFSSAWNCLGCSKFKVRKVWDCVTLCWGLQAGKLDQAWTNIKYVEHNQNLSTYFRKL